MVPTLSKQTILRTNCRICGDQRVRFYYTSERAGVTVYRCLACGSRYVSNEFSDDELQAVYEHSTDFYDQELEWQYDGHARRLREMAALIRGPRDRKPRLLDVGCGAGKFLALAAQEGYEVYGTEFAELPVRVAKQRYGLEIGRNDLSADVRNDYYDVITMWGLVEHVQAPEKLVKEVARLLLPGGWVGILTPVSGLYDTLAYALYVLSDRRMTNLLDHRNGRAHLSILSKGALLSLIERHGLQIGQARRITELGQPIENYLRNVGVRPAPVVLALASAIRMGVNHSVFFRNNILVYAQKPLRT